MDSGQCLETGGPGEKLIGWLFGDHYMVCAEVDDGCAAIKIPTCRIQFAFACCKSLSAPKYHLNIG